MLAKVLRAFVSAYRASRQSFCVQSFFMVEEEKELSAEVPVSGSKSPEASDSALRAKYGRRLAKKKMQKVAAGKGQSQDYFDVYGDGARAEICCSNQVTNEDTREHALSLEDIQNLILWLFDEGISPKWAFVKNKPLISKVAVILLPGLGMSLFRRFRHAMPELCRNFGEPMEVKALSPTASLTGTLEALFMRQIPSNKHETKTEVKSQHQLHTQETSSSQNSAKKQPQEQETNTEVKSHHQLHTQETSSSHISVEVTSTESKTVTESRITLTSITSEVRITASTHVDATPALAHTPYPPSYYLLTAEELQQNGYPLPILSICPETGGSVTALPPGYEATTACPENRRSNGEHLVAIDCEMCLTSAGLELTRLTLLDVKGEVLLDELVLPPNPICDYNTRFSGITPQMMEGVTTTLEEVRAQFLSIVSFKSILVGHSVEADLKSIKVVHRRVIDTALLFPHPRGPPLKSALRTLTQLHLGRSIQGAGEKGHDSVEDARAALDLALLKIRKGPDFGVRSRHKGRQQSILEVLQQGQRGTRAVLVDHSLSTVRSGPFKTASSLMGKGPWEVLPQLAKEVNKRLDQEGGSPRSRGLLAVSTFTPLLSHFMERASSLENIERIAAEAAAARTCAGSEASLSHPWGNGRQAQGRGRTSGLQGGAERPGEHQRAREQLHIAEAQHEEVPKENEKGREAGSGGALTLGNESQKLSKRQKRRMRKLEDRSRKEGSGGEAGAIKEGGRLHQSIEGCGTATVQEARLGEGGGSDYGQGHPSGGAPQAEVGKGGGCSAAKEGEDGDGSQAAHALQLGAESAHGQAPEAKGEVEVKTIGGTKSELEPLLRRMDRDLSSFWNSLPPNTAVIMVSGFGDTPAVRRMREWRYKRLQWATTGLQPWDRETGDPVLHFMERAASSGLCFASVKT